VNTSLIELITGKYRRRILEALAKRWMTYEELMDAIYWDREDGGPECRQTLYVLVRRTNELIIPLGWQIVAELGQGSRYRLLKVKDANAFLKKRRARSKHRCYAKKSLAGRCRCGRSQNLPAV
jgi:hypothetical protein